MFYSSNTVVSNGGLSLFIVDEDSESEAISEIKQFINNPNVGTDNKYILSTEAVNL